MAQIDRNSGFVGELGMKAPCNCATTGPIVLSGLQTIDTYVCTPTDNNGLGTRVLVMNQPGGIGNGIYYVNALAWTLAPDFDGPRDVALGTLVYVSGGLVNASLIFRVIAPPPIYPGTTPIQFLCTFLASAGPTPATNSPTPATNSRNFDSGLIIPFYSYPNMYGDPQVLRLLDLLYRFPSVPVIVIINPASGPGSVQDGNWLALVQLLRGLGTVRVVGYVDSANATVPLATVEVEIRTYTALYGPIDGIFVDNMSNTTPSTDIPYYSAITAYCHANNLPLCVANPGATVPTNGYFEAADIVVINESNGYPTYEYLVEGSYHTGSMGIGVPIAKRAAIAYNVPFSLAGIGVLQQAAQWLYTTDLPPANPYNGLPSYLEALMRFLAKQGETFLGGTSATALLPPVNQPPTLAGGGLAAGTYTYRVTALSGSGETLPSAEESITLAATGGVQVNWAYVAGSTGYRVYGRTAGAELLIATVPEANLYYVDTGAVTPSGGLPTADTSALCTFPVVAVSESITVPPAVNNNEAVPLGQANSLYAPTAGNPAGVFSAAPGTAGNEVVNYSQWHPTLVADVTSSRSAATVYTNSSQAPLTAYLQGGSHTSGTATLSVALNGSGYIPFACDSNSSGGDYPAGSFNVPAGWTYEVSAPYGVVTWIEVS